VTQQFIVTTPANSGKGMSPKAAFDVCQANFTELYNGTTPQVVNVKTFGATGGGIIDDAPAINAAVASLGTSGGTVWYPPGVYLVNSTINDTVSVTQRGAGIDATTVKTNGNFPVFTRAGSATVVINGGGVRDMTIHGSWGATPANTNSWGISCSGSNGAVYENLRIEGTAVGFYTAFTYESVLSNVRVLGAGVDQNSTGFVFDYTNVTNPNNAFYVVNCGAFNCLNDGWDIRNGNGSNFVNCSGELCGGFGFSIGFSGTGTINPQFMQFSNCTGDSCTSANWLIQGTVALPAQDLLFSNNWSGLSSQQNWVFINTINTIFTGNNGISAARDSLFLNGGCAIDVIGYTARNYNTVNAGFSGIDIANSNNNLIVGCDLSTTFTGVGGNSINENGTSNFNVVQNNRMPNGGQVLGANSQFRDNQGFVTEAAGSVSILTTVTTSVVTHGLSMTPTMGEIVLVNNGNFPSWVTGISGTQFTINIPSQGGTVIVGWTARITRH
jgi:hypothetical protein